MSTFPEPIVSMRDAINRGDWAGFIACFDPIPVINDNGSCYEGVAAVRRWSDRELIGAKGTLTLTALIEASEHRAVFDTEWKSSFYTGPGRFTVALENGKISELRIG